MLPLVVQDSGVARQKIPIDRGAVMGVPTKVAGKPVMIDRDIGMGMIGQRTTEMRGEETVVEDPVHLTRVTAIIGRVGEDHARAHLRGNVLILWIVEINDGGLILRTTRNLNKDLNFVLFEEIDCGNFGTNMSDVIGTAAGTSRNQGTYPSTTEIQLYLFSLLTTFLILDAFTLCSRCSARSCMLSSSYSFRYAHCLFSVATREGSQPSTASPVL